MARKTNKKTTTKAPPTTKKKRGRKPDAGSKSGQVRELLATGMKPADIAKKVGCTLPLVYNVRSRMAGGPKKRGPGRPRKNAAAAPAKMDGLDGILAAVKQSEQERAAMRKALEKIQAVIADALA